MIGVWMGRGGPVIGAAALAMALVGCAKQEPITFRTEAVSRGAVVETVSSTGELEALVTVDVGTQVSGQIYRLTADFNDRVTENQVIAEIDPATFTARVEQANADLQISRARVTTAEARVAESEAALANIDAQWKRQQTLFDRGLVAEQAFDTLRADRLRAEAGLKAAKSDAQLAKAQVTQAQALLSNARVDLERAKIRAPIDGVIVAREIDLGSTVAASLQTPRLFVIAQDLSQMRVILQVDEADIGRVRAGQRVEFTVDAFVGANFEGRVEQVRLNPTRANNVVTYAVTVITENPGGRLLPGMTANASIVLEESRDVLRVPAAATRFRPSDPELQAKADALTGRGQSGGGAPTPAGAAQASEPGRGQGARGGGGQGGGQLDQLASDLGLTDAQRETFANAMRTERQKIFAEFQAQGGPPDEGAIRAKMRGAFEKALRSIESGFNDEQKAKLAEIRARQQGGGQRQNGRAVVWLMAEDGALSPKLIETGLNDTTFVELVGDALGEGAKVVVGQTGGPAATAAPTPPRGPGGFGRF